MFIENVSNSERKIRLKLAREEQNMDSGQVHSIYLVVHGVPDQSVRK